MRNAPLFPYLRLFHSWKHIQNPLNVLNTVQNMILLFPPKSGFRFVFVRFHSNRNHSCECWSCSQRKVKFSDLSADRNVTGQIPNCWGCWLRYLAGRKCFKCHLESEVCGWINRSNMTHIYASLVQSHSLYEFGQNSFTGVYSWADFALSQTGTLAV